MKTVREILEEREFQYLHPKANPDFLKDD